MKRNGWNEAWRDRKRELKRAARRAASFFLLYAFLPLFCGALAGGMLWMNAFGAETAEAVLTAYGSQSVMAALGGLPEERAGAGVLPEVEEPFVLPEEVTETLRAAAVRAAEAERAPSEIYDALPEDAVPVIACDLSSRSYCINTTKYEIDVEGARTAPYPVASPDGSDGPLVLVLHTHATESYLVDDTNLSDFAAGDTVTYTRRSTPLRSTDGARTVVQAGEVFCEALRAAGIPVLHCTELHDQEDFNRAYVNSAETVKRLLAEYPSIRYVIDLHRESVTRGDAYVKTYTEVTGAPAAQVMLVVGTNQQGRHPNWLENLSVAVAFKDQMDRDLPGFSRALYLRTARFNQEYLPGCMLLEVGSAMNTPAEAAEAASAAGTELAKVILAHE